MELHIVHTLNTSFCGTVQNVLSVLGIFFEIDDTVSNPFMDKFLAESGAENYTNFDLQYSIYIIQSGAIFQSLPSTVNVYTYPGSLTTP